MKLNYFTISVNTAKGAAKGINERSEELSIQCQADYTILSI